MEFLSVCFQSPCELYFESIQIFIEICTKFDCLLQILFLSEICYLYPHASLEGLIYWHEMSYF